MIQIKNLGKYYGEHKVLHDISLKSVEQGDVFGIVGHSGAGKSTLAALSQRTWGPYSEGTAEVMGHEVSKLKPELKELRKEMGMIFRTSTL